MSHEPKAEDAARAEIPVALFGAGHLSRALLPLLAPAGYPPLAVCSRRIASARSASRLAEAPRPRPTTNPQNALEGVSFVLLAVADRAIAPLASRLAALPGVVWNDRVVMHHAGAAGCDLLAPLADLGAAVAVLHPLQCLGDPTIASQLLPGSRARVEGDRRGRREATRLARALGLLPLRFPANPTDAQRSAYHAAASLVSNDLVALLDLGSDLMERAGVGSKAGREGLVALAQGTLLQAGRGGLGRAVTGPVPRGDLATLQSQLEQLQELPGGAEVHRLLSLRLARMARGLGFVKEAARIERGLAAASGREDKGTV